MRKQLFVISFLAMLLSAHSAIAAVTFTENISELRMSALASVGSPFAFELDGPFLIDFDETGIPSSFGDTLSANAEVTDSDGSSTADGTASLQVDVSSGGGSVTIDMDLSYDSFQQASPGGEFDNANAEGTALIQLAFDLDIAYSFAFTVFGAVASGTPQLEFELRTPGSAAGFDATVENATQDLTFSGVIGPGTDYKIIINVDDSNNIGVLNGASATSMVSVMGAQLVLTPIPLPGALPLLFGAVGLLGALGRFQPIAARWTKSIR